MDMDCNTRLHISIPTICHINPNKPSINSNTIHFPHSPVRIRSTVKLDKTKTPTTPGAMIINDPCLDDGAWIMVIKSLVQRFIGGGPRKIADKQTGRAISSGGCGGGSVAARSSTEHVSVRRRGRGRRHLNNSVVLRRLRGHRVTYAEISHCLVWGEGRWGGKDGGGGAQHKGRWLTVVVLVCFLAVG